MKMPSSNFLRSYGALSQNDDVDQHVPFKHELEDAFCECLAAEPQIDAAEGNHNAWFSLYHKFPPSGPTGIHCKCMK